MRVCNICGTTDDKVPFYRHLNRCRPCALEIISAYNKKRNQDQSYKKARRVRWSQWRSRNNVERKTKPKSAEKRFVAELVSSTKRVSMKKDAEFDVSSEFFNQLLNAQNGLCALSGVRLEKDHSLLGVRIDKIDNTKDFTKDNTRLICEGIKRLKKDMSDDEVKIFIGELKQVIMINLR